MSTQIWGGVWKNSPQPQFSEGFHYDGDMALQEIDVGTTEWVSEGEIGIVLRGSAGQDSNLRQLYFRLPNDIANALARAILSSTESRVPQITLKL